MRLPHDIVLRFAFSAISVLFIRDGYAGIRGRPLWITKELSTQVVKGIFARALGLFMLIVGVMLLYFSWRGTE